MEQHTYKFDGEFNGIIREIIPKYGASITDFQAFENEKILKVEEDDGEYRVHRKGEDETIVVELRYMIVNAMEKYNDGAQFYWPFFDSRNETDYGDMTITIHPPASAIDVQFIGYDNAYETGSLDLSGVVSFDMGYIYSGENGDVRVIYESELFPELTTFVPVSSWAKRLPIVMPNYSTVDFILASPSISNKYTLASETTTSIGVPFKESKSLFEKKLTTERVSVYNFFNSANSKSLK